jgi:hypothetical protein
MNIVHRRLALMAGVSACALGAASPAFAATVEGVRQDATGTIAINLYEQGADDPAMLSGVVDQVSNPGGAASASAFVLCAESATCTDAGAIEQFASGVDEARNSMDIAGAQSVHAMAGASGATATAVAFIDTAIAQLAVSGGKASNTLDVTGSIDVLASAAATATDGPAFAAAAISQAIGLSAIGGTAADVALSNSGEITIAAIADASAQGTSAQNATANALAVGIHALAMTTGTGSANVDVSNDGTLTVAAEAYAESDGPAHALATAVSGIRASADAFDGDASVSVTNSGDLVISALADASGLHTGTAFAAAIGGVVAIASGFGEGNASAAIDNSGSMVIHAEANAQATTNALAIAIGVTAMYEIAHAATGDALLSIDNSGTIDVAAEAHATGLVAEATAVGGAGLFGGAVFQSAYAANGNAIVGLTNDGDISVAADAEANGSVIAYAYAFGGPGVIQFAFATGGDASVDLANNGTIALSANAEAVSTNEAIAFANFTRGVANAAFAASGGDAIVDMTNDGTIAISATAHASADNFATAHASVSGGVAEGGYSFGTGDVQEVLDNSGSIAIAANAAATGATALAGATVTRAVLQTANAIGGGSASIDLTNEGTIAIFASASADAASSTSGYAMAQALASGIRQEAIANEIQGSSGSTSGNFWFHSSNMPSGAAAVALHNDGEISLGAAAHASAGESAFAQAAATATSQHAVGTDASAIIDNSGEISVGVSAAATGGQTAYGGAFVSGLHQFASAHGSTASGYITALGAGHVQSFQGGVGPASASLTNSGTISLVANAQAITTGTAMATSRTLAVAAASAHVGIGIVQGAFGSDASVSIVNDGTIEIAAAASAVGFRTAVADVDADGFAQGAIATGFVGSANFTSGGSGSMFGMPLFQGDATAEFVNTASFDLSGQAQASAEGYARVGVHETAGDQVARGKTASALFDNQDGFSVIAQGTAVGATELGFVQASGIQQEAKGFDAALASVVNSGSMTVAAIAHGTAHSGAASNIAIAGGIEQDPRSVGSATASFVNSGKFTIAAEATASGGTIGFAGAYAAGVHQDPLFGTLNASLDNSGEIVIDAFASAIATGAAYGSAKATGLYVDAADVVADVDNSGSLTVAASAVASGTSGSAYAFAGGISMFAANHGTSAPAGAISGSIVNSGEINVSAKVDAANSGTVGATATGIYFSSTRNNAVVENSGTIAVQAVTAHDGPATAYGIRAVTGFSGDTATADDLFTFTNDGGTLIVRQSTDGGESWHHGMAVDVTDAPNASVINLVGDGVIYGDIAVQAGDAINVRDGTTYFDGAINPTFLPAEGVTGAALDSGLFGVGTLSIADGGNLILADARITGPANMYDGPAYALVDTLDIGSDGTITFQLQPDTGGLQAAGSYPQVFADTANIDGTLVAEVTPANGLYADSYVWQNVIDANTLNGTFDHCALGGSGSLLLNVACSYDSGENVDLTLTRLAFDSVDGLNRNGQSVGAGLEGVYSTSLAGGAAQLFGDLFKITDATKYNVALNQLSGSAYANYLQSFSSLGAHYDDMLDRATGCEVPALAGSMLECRAKAINVWGQLDYQTRRADGDGEAGDSRAKRFTGLIGVDSSVGDAAIVGVSAGQVGNHLRDRQFGDSVKADGMQVGAYAVYDPGAFFVKGMTTYSWFDGDAERSIDFRPLGGTIHGALTGDADVKLWTLGVHAGARLPMGGTSVVTPYANLDYVHAKLGGFTESGLDGANLTVEGSASARTFATAGAKWAVQLGGVVPEVDLAYRYRFGDSRSNFTAAFLGDSASDFDIVSAGQKRGSVLAGLSVGGRLGPVDLRIGYQGEFNGDVTSHSGNFKLVLPLGGKR